MRLEEMDNKDGFYITVNLAGVLAQTTAYYGLFFTAYKPCEILLASEVHAIAGTDGGAVTLDIEKCTGTTAIGSGSSVLASTFDLKSTANTVVRKRGKDLSDERQLKPGDRLAIKDTGALTSLQGIQVTLYLKPLGKGDYR